MSNSGWNIEGPVIHFRSPDGATYPRNTLIVEESE